MRVCVVTSFAGSHWEFSRNLLKSLEKYSQNEQIKVFVDPPFPDLSEFQTAKNFDIIDNSKFKNVINSTLEMETHFKKKWQIDPNIIKDSKQFLWKAAKFHNKVVAIDDIVRSYRNQFDRILWLDSDLELKLPTSELIDYIKFDEDYVIWALERPQIYLEAGIMGFNLNSKYFNEFWDAFTNLYNESKVFELQAWHDAYVINFVVETFSVKYQRDNIIKNINDSWYDVALSDPANQSEISKYITHEKGLKKFAQSNKYSVLKSLTSSIREKLKP